jgi:hypothetical protein
MSQPGWYPDPGGAPGQFRYWDGSSWSANTQSTPGGPPGGGGKKRPVGLIVGIVAAVVVIALIAVFALPGLFGGPSIIGGGDPVDTSTPTKSSWDETSKPTTPPPSGPSDTPSSPQPSGGQPLNCAVGNPNERTSSDASGKLTGGGLQVNQIPGWRMDYAPMGISFAYDVQSQSHSITSRWFSNIAVGAVKKSDGFADPAAAAEIAMQCMASSGFYEGFYKREDLTNEAMTISGKPAHHIRSNIFVTGHEPIEGDVVDVIVVDTGDSERLGIYFGIATIKDSGEALVKAATASLRVA